MLSTMFNRRKMNKLNTLSEYIHSNSHEVMWNAVDRCDFFVAAQDIVDNINFGKYLFTDYALQNLIYNHIMFKLIKRHKTCLSTYPQSLLLLLFTDIKKGISKI